jgi:hypothetical protein
MNIRKIRSQVGFYVMLGMIFLGSIIFYIGIGVRSGSPNMYFVIIGSLMLLPFVFYLIYDAINDWKNKE